MLDRNKPIAGNEKLFEGDGDGEKNPVGIIYTRRGAGEKWTPYFFRRENKNPHFRDASEILRG